MLRLEEMRAVADEPVFSGTQDRLHQMNLTTWWRNEEIVDVMMWLSMLMLIDKGISQLMVRQCR